jgi:hypothetical protein
MQPEITPEQFNQVKETITRKYNLGKTLESGKGNLSDLNEFVNLSESLGTITEDDTLQEPESSKDIDAIVNNPKQLLLQAKAMNLSPLLSASNVKKRVGNKLNAQLNELEQEKTLGINKILYTKTDQTSGQNTTYVIDGKKYTIANRPNSNTTVISEQQKSQIVLDELVREVARRIFSESMDLSPNTVETIMNKAISESYPELALELDENSLRLISANIAKLKMELENQGFNILFNDKVISSVFATPSESDNAVVGIASKIPLIAVSPEGNIHLINFKLFTGSTSDNLGIFNEEMTIVESLFKDNDVNITGIHMLPIKVKTTLEDNILNVEKTSLDFRETDNSVSPSLIQLQTDVALEDAILTNLGTNAVEEEVVVKLEKPSVEQRLKDIQEGNIGTFEYENESQVPEIFKDKISSRGEINGKPFVRVTMAKSLADYYLQEQQTSTTQDEIILDIPAILRKDLEINLNNNERGSKDFSEKENTIWVSADPRVVFRRLFRERGIRTNSPIVLSNVRTVNNQKVYEFYRQNLDATNDPGFIGFSFLLNKDLDLTDAQIEEITTLAQNITDTFPVEKDKIKYYSTMGEERRNSIREEFAKGILDIVNKKTTEVSENIVDITPIEPIVEPQTSEAEVDTDSEEVEPVSTSPTYNVGGTANGVYITVVEKKLANGSVIYKIQIENDPDLNAEYKNKNFKSEGEVKAEYAKKGWFVPEKIITNTAYSLQDSEGNSIKSPISPITSDKINNLSFVSEGRGQEITIEEQDETMNDDASIQSNFANKANLVIKSGDEIIAVVPFNSPIRRKLQTITVDGKMRLAPTTAKINKVIQKDFDRTAPVTLGNWFLDFVNANGAYTYDVGYVQYDNKKETFVLKNTEGKTIFIYSPEKQPTLGATYLIAKDENGKETRFALQTPKLRDVVLNDGSKPTREEIINLMQKIPNKFKTGSEIELYTNIINGLRIVIAESKNPRIIEIADLLAKELGAKDTLGRAESTTEQLATLDYLPAYSPETKKEIEETVADFFLNRIITLTENSIPKHIITTNPNTVFLDNTLEVNDLVSGNYSEEVVKLQGLSDADFLDLVTSKGMVQINPDCL